MVIYRYSQNSVIDEIIFQKSVSGSRRAYLHAIPTTDEKTLSDISLAIAKRGWQAIPHSVGSKFTLEVRGFSRDSQVNELLSENNWVHGTAQKTEEKKESSKFTDTIKKRSLFLSGLAYIIGDIGFFRYGQKENNSLNMVAGLAYAGGTASSLLFARKDMSDLQIKEVANKMAAYMRTQNIDVPESCSLHSIMDDKNKGLIKTADDYFRRYPAEMMNTFFGLAGACITASAIKKINAKNITSNTKHSAILDAGVGTITIASAAFGNLVEEKARDPDSPKKHGLAGVWEWAQERPLAVTGIGYMISTMLHAASTAEDWKHGDSEAKKAVKWRVLFVITNLLAEFLVSISSKGHGKGVQSDKSVDDSIIALTAELIAKQPVSQQAHLVEYMSGFLGRGDVLAMKDTEARDQLRTQMELVKNNPWARCKENVPSSLPPIADKQKNSWQSIAKIPQQTSTPSAFI